MYENPGQPTNWRRFYRDYRTDLNILRYAHISDEIRGVIKNFLAEEFKKHTNELFQFIKQGEVPSTAAEHFMVLYMIDIIDDDEHYHLKLSYDQIRQGKIVLTKVVEILSDSPMFFTSVDPSRYQQFYSRAWFRIWHFLWYLAPVTGELERVVKANGWIKSRRMYMRDVLQPEMLPCYDQHGVAWFHQAVSINIGKPTQWVYFLEIQQQILSEMRQANKVVDGMRKAAQFVNPDDPGYAFIERKDADGTTYSLPDGYPAHLFALNINTDNYEEIIGKAATEWRPGYFYTPWLFNIIKESVEEKPNAEAGQGESSDTTQDTSKDALFKQKLDELYKLYKEK